MIAREKADFVFFLGLKARRHLNVFSLSLIRTGQPKNPSQNDSVLSKCITIREILAADKTQWVVWKNFKINHLINCLKSLARELHTRMTLKKFSICHGINENTIKFILLH